MHFANTSPPSGCVEDLHLQVAEHARHTKKGWEFETLPAPFGNVGLYCYDLNGNELWSKKFESFKTRYNWGTAASPIIAGEKIIAASVRGVVTVIQVDDKLHVLARNDFGEKILATPAVVENKIYLRTIGLLYALGE